jgi:hypothetical protein
MQSLESRTSNGKVVFLVVTVVSLGFAVTMSIVVSELVKPSSAEEEVNFKTFLPLVIAIIAVLLLIGVGVLYSAERVTTLY